MNDTARQPMPPDSGGQKHPMGTFWGWPIGCAQLQEYHAHFAWTTAMLPAPPLREGGGEMLWSIWGACMYGELHQAHHLAVYSGLLER